jgi:hypothetical protein
MIANDTNDDIYQTTKHLASDSNYIWVLGQGMSVEMSIRWKFETFVDQVIIFRKHFSESVNSSS